MNNYEVQILHLSGSITKCKVEAQSYQDAADWAKRNVSNIKEILGVIYII